MMFIYVGLRTLNTIYVQNIHKQNTHVQRSSIKLQTLSVRIVNLVLMTNNSSERFYLTPNIPPCLNISTNNCTYVEEEQPPNPIYPLVNTGIFENSGT